MHVTCMLHVLLQEPAASHVYFIVREDMRDSDVLMQTADTTWQAYNNHATP